ncbi:MAG: hypothetical protein HYU36_03890 [Planctomycetes bacterium]|nr:hypothetical protein [Planctomycetota bacterium]
MVNGSRKPILSPLDHEHFLNHGYVVVKNAVPPDVIARGVAALEAGRFQGGVGQADYKPVRGEAVDACTTDVVHEAIAELFGSEFPFQRHRGGWDMPRPHQAHAEWKVPAAHVDDSYPTIMPNGWAVGTFIFLTRVRPRGGGFVFFRGSPLRYRKAMSLANNCIKGVAARPEVSGPYEEYLAEPGDVLLFQQLMGHSGSANVSDPVTRHALLSRWHPVRRIIPGRKPFDQMTTMEKAYSARYLEDRYGLGLALPARSEASSAGSALRNGVAGVPAVRCHAILHFGGLAHWLFVASASPRTIRHWASSNLIDWQDAGTVGLPTGPAHGLQFHQYGAEAILGVVAGDGPRSLHLYSTEDMRRWKPLDRIEGVEVAAPWYVYPKYPSQVAGGQAVFAVAPGAPSEVACRWGERWEEASRWSTRSTAFRSGDGARIRDIGVSIQFADSVGVLVLDIAKEAGVEATLPHVVLPKDIAAAHEAMSPLAFSCPSPPRQIRVYCRARSYWLVAYLRQHEGQDRLFWGVIDWDAPPLTLRELTTGEALEEAFSVVGFV